MNPKKIGYWLVTALMCALFLFSATMYFTKTEMVQGFFTSLGFPTWIVIPLAIAKVLGIVAVLTDKSQLLREWAYAGFFFDTVLATSAHIAANDGAHIMSMAGIILVLLSRFLYQFRYLD